MAGARALETLAALVEPVGDAEPPCAFLQVRTERGVRDVLFAERPGTCRGIPVLSWRSAPLAGVLLGHGGGDDYEVAVDDRDLVGTVLARAQLSWEAGRLVEVLADDGRWRRGAAGWVQIAGAERRLLPRDAKARRRPASLLPTELDPTQRAAVDLPAQRSVLLLGGAGYGKTTVALHRLAQLHRLARADARPWSAAIIVPTEGLRRLCRELAGRLAIDDITVQTFDAWIEGQARGMFPHLPPGVARDARPAVSRLKRHPALRSATAEVAHGTPAMQQLGEIDRTGPARRRDLLHLFGDRVLLRGTVEAAAGELPESAIDDTIAHTRVQFSRTTEHAMAHADAERLRTLDGRPIDEGTPTGDAERLDAEDFAVLVEIHHLRTGSDVGPGQALARYDHVVLDEAQELAPIELAIVGRAAAHGSITVAGDANQQVDPGAAFRGWEGTLADLDVADPERVVLTESYRCPPVVEAFARSVLGNTVPAIEADAALCLDRYAHACHQSIAHTEALLEVLVSDPNATIAIVLPSHALARRTHADLCRAVPMRLALHGDFRFARGIQVTAVEDIKGLEFDVVLIPDLSPRAWPDSPPSRRALYVAATRATHRLWLTTCGEWSPLVGERWRPGP